ncbi:transposase [Rhodanobacter sp. Root561]|uniref:IS110 family transposase n=1 Tax=Rhodanobacter sp. Root561 TaxID=1736560 RepID=UPI0006F94249|nr:IS110 family transposase [Rhodanobacter sp. Root561]KQZ77880.1 transposase [Rhodanobacter sp. Root561]
MSTITLGVDLAKSVFSVCEVEASGRFVRRLDLKRDAFSAWLAQQPANTVVAMEACSGAHHWAPRCAEHGLQPRLMAAQLVKPFRKSQRSKNDRNDAEAIATAARQGNMHFVPIKSIDQQARLPWHRVREGYKTESLAIGNRLRGLLAEFGIVMGKSDKALRRVLADLDAHPALPAEFKELIRSIDAHARDDERCVRLRAIVGVGALTADALIASLGKAQEFRNGRQLAAWLGMVPTQHSSGGHTRLGAISCRGDGYLRMLLIQGARSSLQRAKAVATEKATPEQRWIRSLAARLSFGKVLVAIANKHARQLWVMLAHDVDYDPCASQRHPMHRPTQLA